MHLATMWLGISGLALMAMLLARHVKGAIMIGEQQQGLQCWRISTLVCQHPDERRFLKPTLCWVNPAGYLASHSCAMYFIHYVQP
jgi:xanthine/uracil/vitamin C permease (AzgA family)